MNTVYRKPTAVVIFGITGDLAQRKLLPALYHLYKDKLLHPKTQIVGISRRSVSVNDLIDQTRLCALDTDGVCDAKALRGFRRHLSLYQMDLTAQDDYRGLHDYLNSLEDKLGICMNRLYYLAIPPQVFGPIIDNMGAAGLNKSCQHAGTPSQLLIEKPFGYDLVSAEELIDRTNRQFGEGQIFRIDHYLAKETAQNILTFRFHNPIFEPLWNNQFVTGISIVAAESIGIEGRATFYEQIGALRDILQSHLLQLLALTTMEKPRTMTSESIHGAKLELLRSIEPIPEDKIDEQAVRGQYRGYKQEVKNDDSATETYAALRLYINNERWRGIPINLQSGKYLGTKKTTISLTFANPPDGDATNTLTFSIQPNEAIDIDLCVKRPGFDNMIDTATMEFTYRRAFDDHGHPDAYERVLVDAIRGDHTLFATSDEVIAGWRIVQPVLDQWSKNADGLRIYKQGTDKP
jgi:glucose-6-phosphate 1-dehydrogenase